MLRPNKKDQGEPQTYTKRMNSGQFIYKAILGIGFPYYSLPFGVTNRRERSQKNCLDDIDIPGSSDRYVTFLPKLVPGTPNNHL